MRDHELLSSQGDPDDATTVTEPFLKLVPAKGWLADYVRYTMLSEAPASFHFFTGLGVLGTAVGRKAWFDKGYYKVYPNHKIILVAPTGKCRKTSALLLGLAFLKEIPGHNILADKVTPEALATALVIKLEPAQGILLKETDAEGVVFAPELAVFLGKQKYNEGLITLLTALFDNPAEWSTQTKAGGKLVLRNVCITFFGASTPDWLISAIPQDAFGGGFMSRLLFVVEEDTPRCYPIPTPNPIPPAMVAFIRDLAKENIGAISFEKPEDRLWYVTWYTGNKSNVPEDSKMAGYHERKPDHMLSMSILLALSEGRSAINTRDMICASKVLTYLEGNMLNTFRWLGVKPVGQNQERLLRIVKANGGHIEYGDLLRKVIFYMDAMEFKRALQTLEESNYIKITTHPSTIQKNMVTLIK